MVRYYTRTGDHGQTSLYTGERVDKDSLVVDAYGTIDELQSFMGFARSMVGEGEMNADTEAVESKLVGVMAQLASNDDFLHITSDDVADIEALVDKYSERADRKGFKFVLPGASPASAAYHMARTVARRAERRVLSYAHEAPVDDSLLQYVNRISDLLYAMSLCADL